MGAITTYIPKGALNQFVAAIVYLDGLGTGIALQRVYQTVIINVGSNFWVSDPYADDVAAENQSTVWINGKHERPFALENHGHTKMYIIGIRPGMLSFFSQVPVADTNDKALSADNWADADIFALRDQLLNCADVDDGFKLIEDYFTTKLQGADLSPLPIINYLSSALAGNTVEEICATLACTRKKLRTYAIRYFGAPVKQMQGIIRFDQHLAAISRQPDLSLSSQHTFYDQAHFINDFKARTGMLPNQYRKLCQQYPQIKYTPNFIPLTKETFLQFITSQST